MTTEPAAATATEPLPPIEVPLLTVRPTGRLAGRTLRMRYPSVGFLIARRRGQASDEVWWAELVDAIEEHDLGRDPAKLPPSLVNAIGTAWVDAMTEEAVPPPSGSG